ncbi:hypothetical protein BLNAU_24234 [Blattamonas nauphoetae]|uniref:Uncharacterized protein n=1 Tax=Blattamonas nauphoetae TaxID=2049346 RepID=A0ABQ9WN08_9EUKA|nr:hypothetical protein BLNAU_24234 [Blattamonas nauphoetae]
MSEGFWDHGKCGQERLPCSSLDFAFSLLTRRPKSAWAQTSLSQLFSNASRQSLLVVKGSTLTLSSTVTITTPPSAAHTASLIKMEGASTMSVSTGCEFKTISQTESGGGAFLSTNGNNNQILSIASSSFESVSSVGDGGVILAQLGAGSKLTVADTTFKLYSSSGKGGALSIVLSSTGSFAVEAGTSFESWSAIMSGSAVFVEAQSLASAITKTSSAGGHASRMEHSELTRLAANGSKTEGKLKPITIELQTGLAQSTPFSCGGHKATITGNTITLSKTGQFTTSSANSVLTLSSLTILFASSQTKPAISVSLGKIVVSGCTIRNGDADIPAVFGSVSGGLLELSGTNTMKLVSPSSSLFDVTSGTLKIGSGTALTHSTTQRTSSLFVLNGGTTLSSTA